MSNEVQLFNHDEFGSIRTVTINGSPWFVVADICNYFGVTNRNRVMQGIDDDEKGGTQMLTPGGTQTVTVVNEAGLYSLLFALQPTKARGIAQSEIDKRVMQLNRFKRWVTHEVLPSIRRHGAYMTPEKIEEALLNPDTLIRLATDLKAEREKRMALQEANEEMRPKALFADAVSASKSSILVGELAKIIKQNGVDGMGQNRLFEWMRNKGYLMKQGSWYNMPTQKSMEMGLFEIKETSITHSDGHVTVSKTPKVTGKGQQYFLNKFLSGSEVR